MKNFFKNAAKVGLGIVIGASMTAFATQLLTNVYLNDGIRISINGVVQDLRDATTGEKEYPLTYKNRTYIPLRSVATLLGFNVGYVEATNTATVDSPGYQPSTPATPAPTASSVDPNLGTFLAEDIAIIKALNWVAPPLKDQSSLLKTNIPISNVVNFIYQAPENPFPEDYVHPQTPLRSYLEDSLNQLRTMKQSLTSSQGLQIYCDPSSVQVLKYGYDSSGKCKGCLATYTLELRATNNGKTITENKSFTSVFIFKDDNNLRLTWVADVESLNTPTTSVPTNKPITPVATQAPVRTLAPTATPAPVVQNPDAIGNLKVDNIACVNALRWSTTPNADALSKFSTGSDVSAVVNLIYMEPQLGNYKKCVHSDSPLTSELQASLNKMIAYRDQNGSISLRMYCDPSSVKYIKYGYDANGVCRGCVATYEVKVSLENTTKYEKVTSVFVFQDSYRVDLRWVGDLDV